MSGRCGHVHATGAVCGAVEAIHGPRLGMVSGHPFQPVGGRGLTAESEALLVELFPLHLRVTETHRLEREWWVGRLSLIETAAAREALELAHQRFHATTVPVRVCDCDPYTWDPAWHDRHVDESRAQRGGEG